MVRRYLTRDRLAHRVHIRRIPHVPILFFLTYAPLLEITGNPLTDPARTIWGCDLQLALLDAQVELLLTQEPHVQEYVKVIGFAFWNLPSMSIADKSEDFGFLVGGIGQRCINRLRVRPSWSGHQHKRQIDQPSDGS